ncbi:MAG: response regulator [Gammaproteobacteria bacterium]|nr:MAG: response regulator [Gammaproteobacteria bacterium]
MNTINTKNKTAEILLIEDNLGDVLLTKEAFRSSHFKYNLRVAKDGDEALKILSRQGEFTQFPRPDLILLDLSLPKIDGREVLEKIKTSNELKDIPIIILSGSEAESDMTTSYDLHANSYVVKPDNFDDFKEIVASIENFWFKKHDLNESNDTIH